MIQEASSSTVKTPLHDAYQQLVASGHIFSDPAQIAVIRLMDQLHTSLTDYTPRHAVSFLKKLTSTTSPPQGLYIYGDVGRGKSMLMDLFYRELPIEKKRRVHFHAFMLEVHEKLHAWRQQHKNKSNAGDPLPTLAKDIAENTWVLCFDELFITDITDAMIVGRLFAALFQLGVVVIATSNRHPDELYKDGLQRERFLPFIDLVHQYTQVINLDAQKDYRLDRLQAMNTLYFMPLGKRATEFAEQSFSQLTNNTSPTVATLHTQGRDLNISRSAGDVAMMSFSELCEKPLGTADYLELATEYTTLILTDIPQMNADMRNEAKRFVTLIDTLYEHKVKLVCTAEVAPNELYISGTGAFEFERTVSRLTEMQSRDYWGMAHN